VTSLRTSLKTAEESLDAIQTTTIDQLEQKVEQLNSSNENLQIQNSSLLDASTRWQKRANELIEKTNKINPEEMKRLQQENENLSKKSLDTEQIVKKLQTDYSVLENSVKTEQTTVTQLRGKLQSVNAEKLKFHSECKQLTQEMTGMKSEIEKLRGSVVGEKKNLVGKDGEIELLKQKVTSLEANLDDHRNTVKQVNEA
jgi:chromosome segregation ATPase